MCGISGIVGTGWERSQLEAMVAVQHHRGPDDSGLYVDETGTIGLGHNRLSIIDLSPAGHQPMANHNGSLRIVFNGEVYNYLELRTELIDYPFRSRTDTEVVLAAYERWGEGCVDHFIGMFAFAIWDSRRQRLFCARDRLGIKPFYFAQDGEAVMFGSEIKALLAAGWPARINDHLVYDYLVCGLYEHTDETFFEGVYALEPGYTLVWDKHGVKRRAYWDLASLIADELEPKQPPKDWREELEALLMDAVRLRLRSDVPLGLHLTGGLDSSSLLALLEDLIPRGGRIEAFTGVYGDDRYDETPYSAQVTRSLEVDLNVCALDLSHFWEIASSAQWHQEQPFGGVATLVYWNMEATAREKGIIVLLEGQGGDELFGGYAYYVADHASDLSRDGDEHRLQEFVREYSAVHNASPHSMMDTISRMQRAAGRSYQDGSEYLRPECLTDSLIAAGGSQDSFPAPSRSLFTNSRFRDIRYTKLPRVLRFNDRMSMAFGCELRVPILDHRIVEFSFRLPNSLLLHEGLPKWPLREAVGDRLPDSVRLAPKRAVVTPQKEWFRGALRSEIEDRLNRSELVRRGYLNGKRARQAFLDFCDDEPDANSFFIWQWMNLDLWIEEFRPT